MLALEVGTKLRSLALEASLAFQESKDQFCDNVPINIWFMIEINATVTCTSVPDIFSNNETIFAKTIRDRLANSSKRRSHFNTYYGHQMMPLNGNEDNEAMRSVRKNGYSVNATLNGGMGGSEEHIVPKSDGVTYEREFTAEEQYIDSSKVPEKVGTSIDKLRG
ncbi:hypothetical protein B0O99DRAFT_595514 [Bisporella sp. PMI_857]|nr:hypothetical protein B0O99DRAFT_595514 [Bisporella sp. PMI_857]